MIDVHADVVGSLLRPPWLQAVREAYDRGESSPAQLKEMEDRAVDDAIAVQERAGMPVVNDGEMRRLSFQDHFIQAVDDIDGAGIDAYLWGEWKGDSRVGDLKRDRPRELAVCERLRVRRQPLVEEFGYLQQRTRRIAKITLTSPSLWANLYDPQLSKTAYPTLDAFLADVLDILRSEVGELVRLGARYIQIDAPHYTAFLDPTAAAFYESRAGGKHWLRTGIALDNALMSGFSDVTFGLHLCRGNQESRWLVEGAYDALANEIFAHTDAHRLLLEYDDDRAGGFEPLAALPDDKMAVLGLVTTKRPHTPGTEDLIKRVRQAARYVDRERLALSTQCGFASSVLGNRISARDQAMKLKTVVETARRIWG